MSIARRDKSVQAGRNQDEVDDKYSRSFCSTGSQGRRLRLRLDPCVNRLATAFDSLDRLLTDMVKEPAYHLLGYYNGIVKRNSLCRKIPLELLVSADRSKHSQIDRETL
jgi:hypothetical protein